LNPEDRKKLHVIISSALEKLHSRNFVHGDFRPSNVFVTSKPEKVWIIDFDWSGTCGVARYPFGMNHVDIKWPEGASDGELLQQKHDSYFLQSFEEKIMVRGFSS
jgi:tRNA A-37 threonylcarbamoyl transferase component Bud32